ncbi:MAG: M23 family metallopeptidase [Elusimicrobia bacterium]|nr:M23 family metallopeptidase [Elusimicrobiota bacterium]
MFSQKVKKGFKQQLTVVLIPHNSINPLKIKLSVPFILFILVLWTGITVWAGYLSGKHVDYWKAKMDYNLMRIRVSFFAQELKKTRGMIEQVKENDESLRGLLDMKSKKAIVENEKRGMGGPTVADVNSLNLTLAGKLADLTQRDILAQTSALRKETQKRIQSSQEIFDYIEKQRTIYRSTPNLFPTMGEITSRFGFRVHPMFKSYEFHSGLDIANERGTKIYATADGKVKVADWQPGFGRLVIIQHNCGYVTYYGHMYKIYVNEGDTVTRGDVIGLMGNSGTSTGTHLHYEIQLYGKPVNPARYLKKILRDGNVQDV